METGKRRRFSFQDHVRLTAFGEFLNHIEQPISLDVPHMEDKYYPVSIRKLNMRVLDAGNHCLTVTVKEEEIDLQGTAQAFGKLGESLVNVFGGFASVGEHFHLDYYEGNQILNETRCHLIFICDR